MERIPITMCHGVKHKGDKPLTIEHFESLIRIASEMGFSSIDYNDLEAWRAGARKLPPRPIMIDFDHAVRSMRYEIHDVLSRYGFRGNLFIHTGPVDKMYADGLSADSGREWMTWEEVGQLMDAGWHIGSHTVNHPNLSKLFLEDPTGEKLEAELAGCDETLEKHLGLKSKDFAFTSTTWSQMAEKLVARRYRFGRLWIIRSTYEADGKEIRYADLVGIPGPDEADGGPPNAARYITRESPAYRLPSMELQGLIYSPAAFRAYLEGALA